MRRFLRYGLPQHIFLLVVSFLLIQGCARSVLQTYPAGELESLEISEAFAKYQRIYLEKCMCCLDAEADAAISVSGWFSDHTGKLSGYLQAMQPGYIKFVAINPLGQPLYILATNGKFFKSLNVLESKAYIGSVRSETFRKFTPSGFDPEFSYYWLTGRLQPGEMQIAEVLRDREQKRYWLKIRYAESSTDSMVLFDPEELIILRHVVRDEKGGHLVDILYEDYQLKPGSEIQHAGDKICRVPAMISVSSHSGAEKIELELSSFLAEAEFSEEDFQLDVPDNFKQFLVK